jgi:hypothetical protein
MFLNCRDPFATHKLQVFFSSSLQTDNVAFKLLLKPLLDLPLHVLLLNKNQNTRHAYRAAWASNLGCDEEIGLVSERTLEQTAILFDKVIIYRCPARRVIIVFHERLYPQSAPRNGGRENKSRKRTGCILTSQPTFGAPSLKR